MQIAAAIVGSAAAAQVIAPGVESASIGRCPLTDLGEQCWGTVRMDRGQKSGRCDRCGRRSNRSFLEVEAQDDEAELAGHAYNNTYETTDAPGVRRYAGERMDVVGSNGRKLIALRSPEGVWIGGCLVSSTEDLERLCAWLGGGNEGGS